MCLGRTVSSVDGSLCTASKLNVCIESDKPVGLVTSGKSLLSVW